MKDHPGSSDGRTPDVCWKLIKDLDGKPVLSPNYGPDVPDSGCPVREQSLKKTVTEAHTSRNGTRLNHVDRNRSRQPRQPSVRGVGVTCPDPTREKRGRSLVAEVTTVTHTMYSTIPARYNTLNNVSIDGDWHRVMTKNRYVKPMGTQDSRTVVSEMDDFETYRTKQTVVADRCTDPVYTVRPDGGTAKALAAGGLRSDNTNDSHVRCLNCHEKKRKYGSADQRSCEETVVRKVTPVVRTVAPDCETIATDCKTDDTFRGYGTNALPVDFAGVYYENRQDCFV